MNSLKLILLCLLLSNSIYSQWSSDPDVNLQLTNWGDAPISAVEDGKGGAFVSTSYNAPLDHAPWYTKSPSLIWIDEYGYHNLDTARILGGPGEVHRNMKLLKDGTGSYFAVFVDQVFLYYIENTERFRDRIIVQKFDSLGNTLWGDGVYISTDTTNAIQHTLFETTSDGSGGCFVYYEQWDSIYGDQGKRIVQHISSDGKRLWGDEGIILYEGRVVGNYSSDNILFDGNDGIITFYQNTYLVNINHEGEILWQLSTSVQPNDHYKFTLLNKDQFALFHYKYEPPLGRMLFDRISLQGEYVDSSITIIDGIDGGIIEDVSIKDNRIFLEWYERTISSVFINYVKKIDFDGNSYFSNKGTQLLDSLGSYAEMFLTDSSIVVVAGHYAQAIDFEGNNLWNPKIIQYSTRYMGYRDYISDSKGGFIAIWLQYLDGVWGQQVGAQGKLGEVVTSIEVIPNDFLPADYQLFQNYPNPFNPATTISYSIPKPSYIELKLYNILGREIATLESGEKNMGIHTKLFNTSKFVPFISSGVYFYSLLIKDQVTNKLINKSTKKMILIK